MRVFLLFSDKDFDSNISLPSNTEDLTKDLGLDVLFDTMSQDDDFILDIIKKVIMNSCIDIKTLYYRQDILKDCLENKEIVREIYEIPIRMKENKRRYWWGIFGSKSPDNLVNEGRYTLEATLESLKELKSISLQYSEKFKSDGFKRFFSMIEKELDDAYIKEVEWHLENLKFEKGILLSVTAGEGNQAQDYILCKTKNKSFFEKIFNKKRVFSFKLHPRDEAGAKVLENIRNMGLSSIANIVASSANHVEKFFNKLQQELAFYIGCLNLAETLVKFNINLCFPKFFPFEQKRIYFDNLKDISLSLLKNGNVIGNKLLGENKLLFIIMGINKGGKTTFLRSIGQSILMAQAGMFVVADSFETNVFNSVFTHFRREEDKSLKHGKFEEELVRINNIVNQIRENSVILFNESFSSTNEYEGSEIAYQIVKTFLDNNIDVFFVTHMYELARYFMENQKTKFLEAKKDEQGKLNFKIYEGKPSKTSLAMDLYLKIFNK